MITRWQEIWTAAPKTTYSAQGRGVPSAVVWRNRELWRADGTVHCSGAVWWALVKKSLYAAGAIEIADLGFAFLHKKNN